MVQQITPKSKQIRKYKKKKNKFPKNIQKFKFRKNKIYRNIKRELNNNDFDDDPDRGSDSIVYIDNLPSTLIHLKNMMRQVNCHIGELE